MFHTHRVAKESLLDNFFVLLRIYLWFLTLVFFCISRLVENIQLTVSVSVFCNDSSLKGKLKKLPRAIRVFSSRNNLTNFNFSFSMFRFCFVNVI